MALSCFAIGTRQRWIRGQFQVLPLRAAFLILLQLGATSVLHAQNLADYDYEDLEFRGVGVTFGQVWPAKVESTPYFGLSADLGYIGPHIRILPSARFWSSSLKDDELIRLSDQIVLVCERQVNVNCPDELELGEVDLSDLELTLDAQYIFLGDRAISPYAGAAAGLHLLNGRGDFIDDTFVEDLLDTVAPGLGPLLGVNVKVGSSLRFGIESRLMLASDIRYASIGIGGIWQLPTRGADSSPPPPGN